MRSALRGFEVGYRNGSLKGNLKCTMTTQENDALEGCVGPNYVGNVDIIVDLYATQA